MKSAFCAPRKLWISSWCHSFCCRNGTSNLFLIKYIENSFIEYFQNALITQVHKMNKKKVPSQIHTRCFLARWFRIRGSCDPSSSESRSFEGHMCFLTWNLKSDYVFGKSGKIYVPINISVDSYMILKGHLEVKKFTDGPNLLSCTYCNETFDLDLYSMGSNRPRIWIQVKTW